MHPEVEKAVEDAEVSSLMRRTLSLLTKLLRLQSAQAWKVMQLACITLWNISCRSKPAETLLVQSAIAVDLLEIAQEL